MSFVDFAELKARITYAEAVKLLDLNLNHSGNQWRGACPVCRGGGERALVITEGRGYFCFADHKGGDQIALVAHIRACSVKEAAQELAKRAGIRTGTSTVRKSTMSTVPESETGEEGAKTFAPLSYLEPEHEAVVAVGFDTDFCKAYGIGYAPKGIMRGTVAIPFRDEQGNLLGYIGVEECRLPPSFTPNVVDFKKSA